MRKNVASLFGGSGMAFYDAEHDAAADDGAGAVFVLDGCDHSL